MAELARTNFAHEADVVACARACFLREADVVARARACFPREADVVALARAFVHAGHEYQPHITCAVSA